MFDFKMNFKVIGEPWITFVVITCFAGFIAGIAVPAQGEDERSHSLTSSKQALDDNQASNTLQTNDEIEGSLSDTTADLLGSSQIIKDRRAKKQGVPVEEIQNPMEVTGAGLTLPEGMSPTEFGNQQLNINNMDVEALNNLLETRNFFTKVASLAGKTLNGTLNNEDVNLVGNTVNVNRISNLSFDQLNTSLNSLNQLSIPSNLDVSSIDPSSSVRVLDSVNISINQSRTSLSVTLPQ